MITSILTVYKVVYMCVREHCTHYDLVVYMCAYVQVDEWRGRASRFLSLCEDIAQLHCSVVGGANRAVLYDLYPYVWDLRNTALVAKAFICWLGEDREMKAGDKRIQFVKILH